MQTDPPPYKPGKWIVLGTVLGAFIGLLVGKFAIGLIFGFFVGLFVDARKSKAAATSALDRAATDRADKDDA